MTTAIPEFKAFPKIARFRRDVVVTEKIDGTNGIIHVAEDGTITAGSRNRWLVDGADNFGFRAWVEANAADLRALGEGYHYGEWWGQGIGRRYGLTEKRFSLFNVARWGDGRQPRPACCGVVPLLGIVTTDRVQHMLDALCSRGSVAAPGFMDPEGVVVFHTASSTLYKVTLDNDAVAKSQLAVAA